jgi:hypothetical protein
MFHSLATDVDGSLLGTGTGGGIGRSSWTSQTSGWFASARMIGSVAVTAIALTIHSGRKLWTCPPPGMRGN